MDSVHQVSDYWRPFVVDSFDYAEFPHAGAVLDVGCGNGALLLELKKRGHRVTGVDVDREALQRCRHLDLDVHEAPAEKLPFADSSFDFVTSKVVLNYTDETLAIREMARVLKKDGLLRISVHGLGYYLRYLVQPQQNAQRLYGARTIINTGYYRVLSRRIPGWFGDTIYQSSVRLTTILNSSGFQVLGCSWGRPFMGQPVFLYITARRL